MLEAGWQALVNYLTLHRIITLTIAFFLSGAIAEFMSQGAVIKYLGPNARKVSSYLVASISGAILAVCSCSVLPMFASIRKKGAGLGPATTFLFAGPAINVLAITFTFTLLGVDIGLVRVISAIVLSILIGVMMFFVFKKQEKVDANEKLFQQTSAQTRKPWQNMLFFLTLLAILVTRVYGIKIPIGESFELPILTIISVIFLIVVLVLYFEKQEIIGWGKATFNLAKKIVPLFIVGVFVAGIIVYLIPSESMIALAGNNSIWANLLSATFGAFLYFATLTEVALVEGFISLGMWKGPATALLLAGPSLSLPNMIVIGRVMGLKRVVVYVGLVIVLAAVIGMLAGLWIYV